MAPKTNAMRLAALVLWASALIVACKATPPRDEQKSGAYVQLPAGGSGSTVDATSGVKGVVQLAGNLGGTASSPTVVGFTIPSEAQGDVLYRNASAWVRLGAGTSGQALVTAGAASNPTWATNFGANALVTTSTLSVGGANVSTLGTIKLPNAGTIYARNFANSADIPVVNVDSSNNTYFGNTVSGLTTVGGLTTVALAATNVAVFQGTTTALTPNVPALSWAKTVASPNIGQAIQTTDVATNTFTITSQAPWASATGTNRNPATFSLKVPAAAAGGTEGTLAINVKATDIIKVSHDGTQGTVDFASVATTTTAPAAGGASALPATPAGYVTIKIGGTSRQIAYW